MPIYGKFIDNLNYILSGYTLNSGHGTHSGYYVAATVGSHGFVGGVGLVFGPVPIYTAVNYGFIVATAEGANGVRLEGYGTVVNGSSVAATGLITGAARTEGDAIALSQGGTIVNGDSSHPGALIQGLVAIVASGSGGTTITNFGTI